MVPFARKADELLLAMEDPRNIEAIEFAKRHTGLIISPHYASHEEITQALNQYKKDIKKLSIISRQFYKMLAVLFLKFMFFFFIFFPPKYNMRNFD